MESKAEERLGGAVLVVAKALRKEVDLLTKRRAVLRQRISEMEDLTERLPVLRNDVARMTRELAALEQKVQWEKDVMKMVRGQRVDEVKKRAGVQGN